MKFAAVWRRAVPTSALFAPDGGALDVIGGHRLTVSIRPYLAEFRLAFIRRHSLCALRRGGAVSDQRIVTSHRTPIATHFAMPAEDAMRHDSPRKILEDHSAFQQRDESSTLTQRKAKTAANRDRLVVNFSRLGGGEAVGCRAITALVIVIVCRFALATLLLIGAAKFLLQIL